MKNRQIILAERPADRLGLSHFDVAYSEVPDPPPGSVVVRTILLSIDPANRAWMSGPTYRDQLEAGEVMAGFSIAEVVAENGTGIRLGTIVECWEAGWQEYAVQTAEEVRPIEILAPLQRHMGVLGVTGLTAYFGLLRVGRPQPGETVVVSAAAGATGHVAGQLARIAGARVVGISGSEDKNVVLRDELGFDATVNYRSESLRDDLRAAIPDGVDVYFDNVGGPLLERMLSRMNIHGRIACCGLVSQYDTDSPAPGPRGVPAVLVGRRIRMEGFLLHDFEPEWAEGSRILADHVNAGAIVPLENVIDGLEQAPQALIDLLAGRNLGKTMIRVAPDPDPTTP
jgi:NADPH-dependent curcumin reductase CurA